MEVLTLAMKAHSGAVESQQRAVKGQLEPWRYSQAMEAHPGAIDTHPGDKDTHPGTMELTLASAVEGGTIKSKGSPSNHGGSPKAHPGARVAHHGTVKT
jgi:hypothetical protein